MPNTSLRRLTTKTLPKIQVNDWRRKFYKSGTAEENSSPRSVWQTPREIPLKVRWKFNEGNSATKVRAAQLLDGNPATGPTNTVQTKKTFTTICYQQCTTTIISYSYFHNSNIRIRQGIVVFRGSVVAAAHHFAGVNSSQFLRFSKIWISLL